MIPDDKPTHLIERAAARLRRPAAAADTAAVVTVARADPPPAPRFAPMPDFAHGKSRPPAIEDIALAKAGLVDWSRRGTRILEEFSIAQNNLLRNSFGGNGTGAARAGNVVMVTSALPGEGKSFISLNMAAAIARQAGRRVLLIDSDPKQGSLGHLFGLSAAPGLLDLLEGGLDLEDLVVPTARENLEFLPLGQGGDTGQPSRARMAGLIEEIGRRDRERLILLDTAPCLASSDPHALAPTVGQVVFVVAAGIAQQDDIEAALDLVQTCPLVSLLLNKIRPGSGSAFGSYEYLSAAHA